MGDSDNDGGISFRCASNGDPLLSTLRESVSAAFRQMIGPRGEADVDVDLTFALFVFTVFTFLQA